jgi:hypothetical protein
MRIPHLDIYLIARIAEAIIHEYCETKMLFPHSRAVLSELLVSSKLELKLPTRIKCQLQQSSRLELFQIVTHRDNELVRHLCLDINCDLEWDDLPNDVRVILMNRVKSQPQVFSPSQLQWIQKNRCNGNVLSYRTYLASQDIHACLTLLIDEYAGNRLREPNSNTTPERRPVTTIDVAAEAERELRPRSEDAPIFKIIFKPFDLVANFIKTSIKFLFLACIAEPEFQRELACVLTGGIFRRLVTFLITRIWIFARFLQNLILPFFFVPPYLGVVLISSFMAVHMSKNSPDS